MGKLISDLRLRLLSIVLAATLPALILMLITGFEQRAQAAEEAQANALRLAHFTVINNETLIEDTRVLLLAMTHSFNFLSNDDFACQHIFSHLALTHFPFYSAFYVADLHGNILCSMPGGEIPPNLLGCDHYQNLIKAEDFVISTYHLCRNSGEGVIAMGYPIHNNNDERIGVINIGIDLKWFNTYASQAELPPGSTLTVIDQRGIILAHYPDPAIWVGQTINKAELYQTIITKLSGTTELTGPDGIERLYAFVPLIGTDNSVFVNVGIPTAVAYANAERTMVRNLIFLAIASTLALLAAWFFSNIFILRQTQQIVATTEKLANGQLDARTNLPYERGELSSLARSIDRLAVALSQREMERDAAEQAMRAYATNLERSNRDLLDFANITSHDLQEPLRKIQTFSELLTNRYHDEIDEQGQDYLQRMHLAAQRMQELIISLLSYSRLSTRANLLESSNLNEIVQQATLELDLQIEESSAKIYIGDLPTITADPIQMQMLFSNLISNALKFRNNNHHPHITVTSEKTSSLTQTTNQINWCEIWVTDNGIGFDSKYLDRIFKPFERLHAANHYPGTGMGLAICRKIVERHGGSITAQSQPGKGATFIIRLPYQQPSGETK